MYKDIHVKKSIILLSRNIILSKTEIYYDFSAVTESFERAFVYN